MYRKFGSPTKRFTTSHSLSAHGVPVVKAGCPALPVAERIGGLRRRLPALNFPQAIEFAACPIRQRCRSPRNAMSPTMRIAAGRNKSGVHATAHKRKTGSLCERLVRSKFIATASCGRLAACQCWGQRFQLTAIRLRRRQKNEVFQPQLFPLQKFSNWICVTEARPGNCGGFAQ